MSDMQGKVALVTGGTSGIGREAALAFARRGAKVVVTGRREPEGAETVELVKKAGGEARFFRADVAQAEDAEAMVREAVSAFGRLDFAFNNAGVEGEFAPLADQTDANYQHVFDINVKGLWLSMKHEIPAILRSGGGSIVNTSSVAGLMGFAGASIYAASKHAVIGLTRSAALEYAKQGLRVNAICPGAIQTEMLDRGFPNDEARAKLIAMHPIGRIGRVEEVGGAVAWLCSAEASFLTGVALPIDGGVLAG